MWQKNVFCKLNVHMKTEEQHVSQCQIIFPLYQKPFQSLLLNFPLKLEIAHSVLALLLPIDEGREGENRHPLILIHRDVLLSSSLLLVRKC